MGVGGSLFLQINIEALPVFPETAEPSAADAGSAGLRSHNSGRARVPTAAPNRSKQRHLEAEGGYCRTAAARPPPGRALEPPGDAERAAGQLPW